MTTLVENSDNALKAMTNYDWVTYLTTNRICPAIKDVLLENKYMYQAFGKSIHDYNRDDFMSRELPAVCIYSPTRYAKSRFFQTIGDIYFNIFLPIKLTRQDTTAVFNTLGKYFGDVLQSQPFWFSLIDKIVPLPPPSSPIYNDVLRYKNRDGSPLVDFAKEIIVKNPNMINLKDIGDVWKLEIRTQYVYDMMNYYAMLEEFGINGDIDPNRIVYEILQNFSVDVKPLIT